MEQKQRDKCVWGLCLGVEKIEFKKKKKEEEEWVAVLYCTVLRWRVSIRVRVTCGAVDWFLPVYRRER